MLLFKRFVSDILIRSNISQDDRKSIQTHAFSRQLLRKLLLEVHGLFDYATVCHTDLIRVQLLQVARAKRKHSLRVNRHST